MCSVEVLLKSDRSVKNFTFGQQRPKLFFHIFTGFILLPPLA
jgi:hypothetical protein